MSISKAQLIKTTMSQCHGNSCHHYLIVSSSNLKFINNNDHIIDVVLSYSPREKHNTMTLARGQHCIDSAYYVLICH